jgi:phytoene dehydrogenase-like protein
MSERYDAIVVGAGHNGLVCASLLAESGKKVLVLEANSQVGGAAVTRSFADGYSVSSVAHLLYQLQPQVIKGLGLNIETVSNNMGTIALSADGNHVRFNGDEVSGVGDEDVAQFRDFRKRMTRFAKLLKTFLNKTPPRLANEASKSDLFTLAQLGLDIRRLGKVEMQEFLTNLWNASTVSCCVVQSVWMR